MTSTLEHYARVFMNMKDSHASPMRTVMLLTIIDMIEDGEIYENHIPYDTELECQFEEAWSRYVGGKPDISAISPVWHLNKEKFWHLHAEHESQLMERTTTPGSLQFKEMGGWFYIDEDLYLMLQTSKNRAKLRQILIVSNICQLSLGLDEGESYVFLEEYEELEEENDALKKSVTSLRTELSNAQNLLRQASQGENVTLPCHDELLKEKDEIIEKFQKEVKELKEKNGSVAGRFRILKEERDTFSEQVKQLRRLLAEKDIQLKEQHSNIEVLRKENEKKEQTLLAVKNAAIPEKSSSIKTSSPIDYQTKQNEPSALLGGVNQDYWQKVLEWAITRTELTSPQLNFIKKALGNFGCVIFTPRQQSFARSILEIVNKKGFMFVEANPDNSTILADEPRIAFCSQYKSRFQSLHVSNLFGTPAPHKPILLIAIMSLIERGYYRTSVIMPGEVLEREFESVWKSLVPKDCKYSCVYWTPYWYMKSEPFWTIVPKLGCSVEGKDWLSEKEAKSMITGARLDENLFQLMQSPAARKELKQALIEKYLTNK